MIRNVVGFAILCAILVGTSPAGGQDAKPQSSATGQKPKKNVAIFVFHKVQIIDFAGPYEVFANASAANDLTPKN